MIGQCILDKVVNLLGEICLAALFVDKKGVKVGTKRFGLLASHTAFDAKFPGLVVDSDQA